MRGSLLPLPDDPPIVVPVQSSPDSARVLVVLLAHHSAGCCAGFVRAWTALRLPLEDLLLVHGGDRKDFEEVSHPWKVFVEDPRLRARAPRQENQSLAGVFQAIAQNLSGFSHVLFAEYDLVPLGPIDQLCAHGVKDLAKSGASVLFPTLYRVDTTCQEIYLQQACNPEFVEFWRRVSLRPDASRAYWALLPGSFWEAQAIFAAANNPEPFPCYFEIFMPTLLHHLGYRIQKWPECPMLIHGGGNLTARLDELRASGCLAAHPVKQRKLKSSDI